MSREVRRVPMDYQHPRCLVPDHQHGGLRVAFVPLFPGERYMESLTEFRSDPADWDFEPPRFDARGDLMTDWRAWEVESTLDEARAAEVARWGWPCRAGRVLRMTVRLRRGCGVSHES